MVSRQCHSATLQLTYLLCNSLKPSDAEITSNLYNPNTVPVCDITLNISPLQHPSARCWDSASLRHHMYLSTTFTLYAVTIKFISGGCWEVFSKCVHMSMMTAVQTENHPSEEVKVYISE